ncbi:MAG TPA: hypothetical protein DCW83_06000 [Saprospirales bacterium]|jgi:hypothetical protein|nr:hypothetical protein [Saprospirales bacterium]
MIKVPERIQYSMLDTEIEYLRKQAYEISQCPVRSHDRDYDTCFAATLAGSILEFALVHQGATKNPKEFDITDPDSYAWDVIWDSGKTEVKRKRFLKDDRTQWYSVDDPTYVKTFQKNIRLVDHFVVGDYKVIGSNQYDVQWMLITKVGNDFNRYMKESMYNKGQLVYYHTRDPKCQHLMKEVVYD